MGEIIKSGCVSSEEIAGRGIIDRHYASIAGIGMARDTSELSLGAEAQERFWEGYGKSYAEAEARGEIYTAATAVGALGMSPSDLLSQCLSAGYVKLGPGFYCASLSCGDGRVVYVLNGFYAR